jgi:hypothetical protein
MVARAACHFLPTKHGNALLKEGSKSDKIDARRLAELLRSGMLRAVYLGENGLATLRELARAQPLLSMAWGIDLPTRAGNTVETRAAKIPDAGRLGANPRG